MSETAEKINRLVELLSPDAQEYLLHVAEFLAIDKSFYGQMTAEQRQKLDQAILEADEDRANSPTDLQFLKNHL